MTGTDIKITSSSGSDFDAYLAMPASGAGPGVVVAPAVHGINQGIRDFTDRRPCLDRGNDWWNEVRLATSRSAHGVEGSSRASVVTTFAVTTHPFDLYLLNFWVYL